MLRANSRSNNSAGYKAGKSVPGSIKLSANENRLGHSPNVMHAINEIMFFNLYPPPTSFELLESIGKIYNLPPEQIVCGVGSDQILELLPRIYTDIGDEVIYTKHGFAIYLLAAKNEGAIPVMAEEIDYRVDVDEILKKVTLKTRMVYVANPGNPTGTYIPKHEMQRLRDRLTKIRNDPKNDILLVIDSAYAESVTADDYSDGHEIAASTDNTIMTRTFSKLYGIAGFRVGWAFGHPDIIGHLNGKREIFNLATPSIIAAIEAVKDQDFLLKCKEHNAVHRDQLTDFLNELGYPAIPSQANFVTAKFGDAKKALNFLENQRITVREIENYYMPEHLRITIGDESDMKLVFDALKKYRKLDKGNGSGFGSPGR